MQPSGDFAPTGDYGPSITFDTNGVEFGPWLRQFIAQIKRNWFSLIPYRVATLKGHVTVQFYVHKNGAISDINVCGPSKVAEFNDAAFKAVATSNRTYPLPPAYPDKRAFFAVTFFYNETPPSEPPPPKK